MSRYFFHIRDGLLLVPDEEGVELQTMNDVIDEAQASARDMANAALRSRSIAIIASIVVEDEQGNRVEAVPRAWVH